MQSRAQRSENLVGKTLGGRYLLTHHTWSTEKGAGYLATHDEIEHRVAVLFDRDDEGITSALAELQHPHLESMLEAGRDLEQAVFFLVSKPSEGRSALHLVEQMGALEPVTAVRIVLQACRGVMAAHRVGVAHGSLSLARFILVPEDDELLVQVSDFALGTASATPAQDLHAIGRLTYHLLGGAEPDADTRHLQDLAPWVEPGLALLVHAVLGTAGRHFDTVEAFASALRAFSENDELLTEANLAGVSASTRERRRERADLGAALEAYAPQAAGAESDSHLVGKRLGERYTVRRMIGRGGMGAVYEVATDEGDRFAAKVVLEGVSAKHKNSLKRFAVEAKSAVGIRGAHVVKTLETGTDEELGVPYIIMELLEGRDLFSVWQKAGPLRPMVAARLVLQAAYGIAAAHERGVIHRDIKPANLFLQFDDLTGLVNVKVCDFGVAKRTQFAAYESSYFELTRTGRMLGSPLYMSPEQARSAKHVDSRTDVFSLSIVLWEALSGRRLWGEKPSLGDLVMAICTGPIPRLESVAPWVPQELAAIVHRGLERDLGLRYADMREMATALERFTGGAAVKVRDLAPLDESERQLAVTEHGSTRPDGPREVSAPSTPRADTETHRLRLVAWSLAVLFVLLAGLLTTLL